MVMSGEVIHKPGTNADCLDRRGRFDVWLEAKGRHCSRSGVGASSLLRHGRSWVHRLNERWRIILISERLKQPINDFLEIWRVGGIDLCRMHAAKKIKGKVKCFVSVQIIFHQRRSFFWAVSYYYVRLWSFFVLVQCTSPPAKTVL